MCGCGGSQTTQSRQEAAAAAQQRANEQREVRQELVRDLASSQAAAVANAAS